VFGVSEVVVAYIIHSLHMLSHYRDGHLAFLTTLTEVMLLLPMLRSYVPKARILIRAICTRANPSMDSMLFPGN
jgi:hypothetical protein